MHVFMTLVNWPLCIRIFCLSVLVSWGRKNTYNSVTVSSLLIQLSQKKLKGKITSAIHVFLNQQQQQISDKSWGCGFTTRKNGILLSKLFWPTVRKNCYGDREKRLKFDAEGREFPKKIEITRIICLNSERYTDKYILD